MKNWKTIEDLLLEDQSLLEKHSYEEFVNSKMTPENSDVPIVDVFKEFDKFIARREKEKA